MIRWAPYIAYLKVCDRGFQIRFMRLTLVPGQVKVIISPHNAHALRATNGIPCDAYCQHIDGAFLDFYSNAESKDLSYGVFRIR
jgi:hypothetical protein